MSSAENKSASSALAGAVWLADERRVAAFYYALGAAPTAALPGLRASPLAEAAKHVHFAPSPLMLQVREIAARGADDPRDARAVALVDLDCDVQQRHFEAAFARRADRWRVARRARRGGRFDESERAALRVEEYETTPWDVVMGGDSGGGGGGSGGGGGAGAAPAGATVAVGASNFCVRKGLGRKAVMAEALRAHAAKCGAACPLHAALPETVVVDAVAAFHARPAWLDFRSALAEALAEAETAIDAAAAAAAAAVPPAPPPLWVLKPSITNKGEGLCIVSNAADVAAAVRETPEMGQWVLQRYVDRPLLLRPVPDWLLSRLLNSGRGASGGGGGSAGTHKFHLRVYVLAAGALAVHVFREALVLIAAEPYDRAGALDPARRAAHVTNTCVARDEAGADFDEALHVRSSGELAALLLASGAAATRDDAEARVAAVFAEVRAAVAHCFRAMEGRVGLYLPLPAPSFELYGVDFLVDADFRVLLLEFNPTPDVKMTGALLDGLVGRLIDGSVGIATGEGAGESGGEWDTVYAKVWPQHGGMRISVT